MTEYPAADPRIAAALGRAEELADSAPEEHVAIYEDVHETLQQVLTDAGQSDPGQAGLGETAVGPTDVGETDVGETNVGDRDAGNGDPPGDAQT